jgi:hypothetical protein
MPLPHENSDDFGAAHPAWRYRDGQEHAPAVAHIDDCFHLLTLVDAYFAPAGEPDRGGCSPGCV